MRKSYLRKDCAAPRQSQQGSGIAPERTFLSTSLSTDSVDDSFVPYGCKALVGRSVDARHFNLSMDEDFLVDHVIQVGLTVEEVQKIGCNSDRHAIEGLASHARHVRSEDHLRQLEQRILR